MSLLEVEIGKIYEFVGKLEEDGIHPSSCPGMHIGEKGIYSIMLNGIRNIEDNGSCFFYTVRVPENDTVSQEF